MNRISGPTFFYKKTLPGYCFGFLLIFTAISVTTGNPSYFILIPIFLSVLLFFILRILVWDLVDEVFDCGDSLLFREKGVEQLVPLSEVVNIDVMAFSSPERVTVRTRTEGELGRTNLTFAAPMRLNVLSENSMVNDLIRRVDEARSARIA